MAAGTALEIVEQLVILLTAQLCPGDPACRPTDQSTEDGYSDAADGDPYRTACCPHQGTG